jgi:hypothetical protein
MEELDDIDPYHIPSRVSKDARIEIKLAYCREIVKESIKNKSDLEKIMSDILKDIFRQYKKHINIDSFLDKMRLLGNVHTMAFFDCCREYTTKSSRIEFEIGNFN